MILSNAPEPFRLIVYFPVPTYRVSGVVQDL